MSKHCSIELDVEPGTQQPSQNEEQTSRDAGEDGGQAYFFGSRKVSGLLLDQVIVISSRPAVLTSIAIGWILAPFVDAMGTPDAIDPWVARGDFTILGSPANAPRIVTAPDSVHR